MEKVCVCVFYQDSLSHHPLIPSVPYKTGEVDCVVIVKENIIRHRPEERLVLEVQILYEASLREATLPMLILKHCFLSGSYL